MRNLNGLLHPGERVDWSQYPWRKPQEGDIVRARPLFDLDPQDTQPDSHVVSLLTDCVVRNPAPSVNPGLTLFSFWDIHGHPLPGPERRYSEYEFRPSAAWSGCSYWGEELWYSDWIPLYAIKPPLIGAYAARLARRAEMQRLGVYA